MTTATRTATIADIIRRLQSSTYPKTAIDALGWGMGPAQHHITTATKRAQQAGLLSIETDPRSRMNGKQYVTLTEAGKDWTPQPMFTLKYRTPEGSRERVLTAAGVEQVGRVVMNLADRDMATDIEVLDETGGDVTFDFACFV